MKRRKRYIALGVLSSVILAAAVLVWQVGRHGSGALETWVGSQIINLVNSRLNTTLSFDDLDYRYPGTVTLKNLRFAAPNPEKDGDSVDIITCRFAELTLGEVPKINRPIVIEKLVFDQPVIRVQAAGPHSGEMVGFSHIVRHAPGETSRPSDPNASKLSDVLQVRLIRLIDAAVIYDQRIGGTEPMVLDHLTTDVVIAANEAGWYRIDTHLTRSPIFDMRLAGELNLDDSTTRNLDLNLRADLGEGKPNYLPPQLQRMIERNQVRGLLELRATGSIPLDTAEESDLEVTASLANAHVAIGEYHVPVQRLDVVGAMNNGRVIVRKMEAAALGGNTKLSGWVKLNDMLDGYVNLQISHVMLEQFMASRDQDGSPKLAGKFGANLEMAAPMEIVLAKTDPPATRPASTQGTLQESKLPEKWGTGGIHITDGKLVNLPVIRLIATAAADASKLVPRRQAAATGKPSDRLDVTFDMTQDRAKIKDMLYITGVIGAIGDGDVELNGDINLMVHGGPIERIRGGFGKTVGKAVGTSLGEVVSYRIFGNLDDPKVRVVVGGDVGEKVREMFHNLGNGLRTLLGGG